MTELELTLFTIYVYVSGSVNGALSENYREMYAEKPGLKVSFLIWLTGMLWPILTVFVICATIGTSIREKLLGPKEILDSSLQDE